MDHPCLKCFSTVRVSISSAAIPISATTSGTAGSKRQAYMALSQENNFLLQSRLYGSPVATTSGRPSVVSPPATVLPPLSSDLVTSLYSPIVEIDHLVRLQMQVKQLRVKEVELERVKQRNRELEELLMRLSSESQVWSNYAKSTVSAVSCLRLKLDHILTKQNKCWAGDIKEGYSDSAGDVESVFEANEETELNGRTACRGCREREVCVLLLPCRHLCLCSGCEAKMDTCPVCNSTRNASIQVVVP